jgi:hypothetical protein
VFSLKLSGTHNIANVICNLELAIRSSSFGVHDSLWDTLAVKVGELVDQVKVLQQERSIPADALRGLGVEDLRVS